MIVFAERSEIWSHRSENHPATSTPTRLRNATATMTATIAAPTFRSRRMRLSGGGTSTGMVSAIASLNVRPLLPSHTTRADTVDARPGG